MLSVGRSTLRRWAYLFEFERVIGSLPHDERGRRLWTKEALVLLAEAKRKASQERISTCFQGCSLMRRRRSMVTALAEHLSRPMNDGRSWASELFEKVVYLELGPEVLITRIERVLAEAR